MCINSLGGGGLGGSPPARLLLVRFHRGGCWWGGADKAVELPQLSRQRRQRRPCHRHPDRHCPSQPYLTCLFLSLHLAGRQAAPCVCVHVCENENGCVCAAIVCVRVCVCVCVCLCVSVCMFMSVCGGERERERGSLRVCKGERMESHVYGNVYV